jgi:hypothetical protein
VVSRNTANMPVSKLTAIYALLDTLLASFSGSRTSRQDGSNISRMFKLVCHYHGTDSGRRTRGHLRCVLNHDGYNSVDDSESSEDASDDNVVVVVVFLFVVVFVVDDYGDGGGGDGSLMCWPECATSCTRLSSPLAHLTLICS